jgi:hypothetical protein
MAKQSFQNDRLGANRYGLASTGFNVNRDALIDRSKVASSSKYGKTEIQRAHPGWNVLIGLCRHPGHPPRMTPSSPRPTASIPPTARLISGFRPRPRAADMPLITPTLMEMGGSPIPSSRAIIIDPNIGTVSTRTIPSIGTPMSQRRLSCQRRN